MGLLLSGDAYIVLKNEYSVKGGRRRGLVGVSGDFGQRVTHTPIVIMIIRRTVIILLRFFLWYILRVERAKRC